MSNPHKIEHNLSDMIGGCKLGEPDWQRVLYEVYFGFSFSICYRYAASKEDTFEIVNDGFVKVFRGIVNFQEPNDENILSKIFMGWLKKIMINTGINYYQSIKRKEAHVLNRLEITDVATEKNGIDNLAYLDLIKLIQQLSPAYRNTFSLFAIEGCTHEEISEILGISIGTSKSNLMKARKNLRRMLEQLNG